LAFLIVGGRAPRDSPSVAWGLTRRQFTDPALTQLREDVEVEQVAVTLARARLDDVVGEPRFLDVAAQCLPTQGRVGGLPGAHGFLGAVPPASPTPCNTPAN
jgi:hypothetical protein